jgi:hypothetical protein
MVSKTLKQTGILKSIPVLTSQIPFLVPPSYSASVGGLSAVEGNDSQPTEYTPLYYEYNFQNLHAGIKSEETRKMVVPKFSNQ